MMTAKQWKAFEESGEWKEVKAFVLKQLADVRDELEDTHAGMDREEARELDTFNKGRASELRFISDLPDIMAGVIESGKGEQNEEKKREVDDGNIM